MVLLVRKRHVGRRRGGGRICLLSIQYMMQVYMACG